MTLSKTFGRTLKLLVPTLLILSAIEASANCNDGPVTAEPCGSYSIGGSNPHQGPGWDAQPSVTHGNPGGHGPGNGGGYPGGGHGGGHNQPPRPNYPDYPSQPSYPTYPSYPSQPSYPSYPSYPSQPSYPSYPSQPSYPSYPSYPTQPSYPSYPVPVPPVVQPMQERTISLDIYSSLQSGSRIDLAQKIRLQNYEGWRVSRVEVEVQASQNVNLQVDLNNRAIGLILARPYDSYLSIPLSGRPRLNVGPDAFGLSSSGRVTINRVLVTLSRN